MPQVVKAICLWRGEFSLLTPLGVDHSIYIMNILRSLGSRSTKGKNSKLAQSEESGESKDGKGGDGQSASGLDDDFHKVDAATSGDKDPAVMDTNVPTPSLEETTEVGKIEPLQMDDDDGEDEFYDTDPGLGSDHGSVISDDDAEERDDLPRLTASILDWNWVPVADDEVIEVPGSPITEEQFKTFLSEVNKQVEATVTDLEPQELEFSKAEKKFRQIALALTDDVLKLGKRATATQRGFLASDRKLDVLALRLKMMESERRSVLDHVQEFGETQQTLEKLEEWWKELTELQESEERVRIEQDKVQDEFSRCIFGTKGSGGGGD